VEQLLGRVGGGQVDVAGQGMPVAGADAAVGELKPRLRPVRDHVLDVRPRHPQRAAQVVERRPPVLVERQADAPGVVAQGAGEALGEPDAIHGVRVCRRAVGGKRPA
jgi:hypothetical protein